MPGNTIGLMLQAIGAAVQHRSPGAAHFVDRGGPLTHKWYEDCARQIKDLCGRIGLQHMVVQVRGEQGALYVFIQSRFREPEVVSKPERTGKRDWMEQAIRAALDICDLYPGGDEFTAEERAFVAAIVDFEKKYRDLAGTPVDPFGPCPKNPEQIHSVDDAHAAIEAVAKPGAYARSFVKPPHNPEDCRFEGVGRCPGCCTDYYIENGERKRSNVDPMKFGPHDYPGAPKPPDGECWTSDCKHGCGCYAGPHTSGGPVDPFGPCPKNPQNPKLFADNDEECFS